MADERVHKILLEKLDNGFKGLHKALYEYEKSVDDMNVSDSKLKDMHKKVENERKRCVSLIRTLQPMYVPTNKEIDMLQKSLEERIPVFKLNYRGNLTFINLSDIRFSQQHISYPFGPEIESNIGSSMDNYPLKFYNFKDDQLVILGMLGENDYTQSDKVQTLHNPTIPALNVVMTKSSTEMPCFVSIDNRRLELIYRQLCLLMNGDVSQCTVENMANRNSADFLADMGITSQVYVPCYVKRREDIPPIPMKTVEGVQREKINKMIGVDGDKRTFAAVIAERVLSTDTNVSKVLEGYQTFPSREDLHDQTNKYECEAKGVIDGFNVGEEIDSLIDSGKIRELYSDVLPKDNYANLKKMCFHISNKIIKYLSRDETLSVNESDLYDNSKKILPSLSKWKRSIYKNKLSKSHIIRSHTRQRSASSRSASSYFKSPIQLGGKPQSKSKRCKNGYRRNAKTRKCVKKHTVFRIGVDFGGVLAKHTREGEEDEKVIKEHKDTHINMPGAVKYLRKLKDKGHHLYIISFCGKKRALEGRAAIEENGLSDVFDEQIYINNAYKKGHVVSSFGCNFMIDDRLELLNSIKIQYPFVQTILFGKTREQTPLPHLNAETWEDVYNLITKTPQFVCEKMLMNYNKYNVLKNVKV